MKSMILKLKIDFYKSTPIPKLNLSKVVLCFFTFQNSENCKNGIEYGPPGNCSANLDFRLKYQSTFQIRQFTKNLFSLFKPKSI